MTRYVTIEDTFDCPKCDTKFALREAIENPTDRHWCPCCTGALLKNTLSKDADDCQIYVWHTPIRHASKDCLFHSPTPKSEEYQFYYSCPVCIDERSYYSDAQSI